MPNNGAVSETTRTRFSLDRRRAGILLHLTSLPGPGANGDLGAGAYRFVDFLADAGVSVWQMLPVGPTHPNGSPYQTVSVHAGEPSLVSLEKICEAGWLTEEQLRRSSDCGERRRCLSLAWRGFRGGAAEEDQVAYADFCRNHAHWLEDYVLFRALSAENDGRGWWAWKPELRSRDPDALSAVRARLALALEELRFEQFVFFRQWEELKRYANERGVHLFGDLPIFVAHDSAEVWARPGDFFLDEDGMTEFVAGVPPDYFSATGQRWGNPLYRWDRLREEGFEFWVQRLETQFLLFDMVRIDHFRGFESYWEIPAAEKYAINGRWVKAPGDELFEALRQRFGCLPLIAEDLGLITPEVEELRLRYGMPGMKILQFAFSGEPDNPYLPHNHTENCVVYTGTHDNDTTLGWLAGLDEPTRTLLDEYLGRPGEEMPWPLIRCALASVARLAIVPMQDVLCLDGKHRMNMPGTTEGNWCWRFDWGWLSADLAARLRNMNRLYDRLEG